MSNLCNIKPSQCATHSSLCMCVYSICLLCVCVRVHMCMCVLCVVFVFVCCCIETPMKHTFHIQPLSNNHGVTCYCMSTCSCCNHWCPCHNGKGWPVFGCRLSMQCLHWKSPKQYIVGVSYIAPFSSAVAFHYSVILSNNWSKCVFMKHAHTYMYYGVTSKHGMNREFHYVMIYWCLCIYTTSAANALIKSYWYASLCQGSL